MVQSEQKSIKDEALRRLRVGMERAAQRLVDLHREDVTTNQVNPVGSKSAERSRPGQYPYRETGQGADNIFMALSQDGTEAKVGYRGEDDPLAVGPLEPTHYRAGGEHMRILTNVMDRKGIRDTYFENIEDINSAFKSGTQE